MNALCKQRLQQYLIHVLQIELLGTVAKFLQPQVQLQTGQAISATGVAGTLLAVSIGLVVVLGGAISDCLFENFVVLLVSAGGDGGGGLLFMVTPLYQLGPVVFKFTLPLSLSYESRELRIDL